MTRRGSFANTGAAERPVVGNTNPRVEPAPKSLILAYDYNQLYLRDAAHELSPDGNAYLDVLDAATRADLTVGAASGDHRSVLIPRAGDFAANLELSTMSSSPPLIRNRRPCRRVRPRLDPGGSDSKRVRRRQAKCGSSVPSRAIHRAPPQRLRRRCRCELGHTTTLITSHR